jgi:hypothetical protein
MMTPRLPGKEGTAQAGNGEAMGGVLGIMPSILVGLKPFPALDLDKST